MARPTGSSASGPFTQWGRPAPLGSEEFICWHVLCCSCGIADKLSKGDAKEKGTVLAGGLQPGVWGGGGSEQLRIGTRLFLACPHVLCKLCRVIGVCGSPLSEVWTPAGSGGLWSLRMPSSPDLGTIPPTCPSSWNTLFLDRWLVLCIQVSALSSSSQGCLL